MEGNIQKVLKVAGDADRHPSSASDIQRRENRIPNLTYPNGVTLILPTTLCEKGIRGFHAALIQTEKLLIVSLMLKKGRIPSLRYS